MSERSDTDELEYQLIRDKAVELLARREHSRRELLRKLSQRFPASLQIDTVVDGLAEDGYQSDQRFADAKVRAAIARGHGPIKLQHALREAGIEAELADAAMEAAEVSWTDQAQAVLITKFGRGPAQDRKEQARRARFLASRGFPSHIVGDLVLS